MSGISERARESKSIASDLCVVLVILILCFLVLLWPRIDFHLLPVPPDLMSDQFR